MEKTAKRVQDWRQGLLPSNATIGRAIQNLNETSFRIVLIATEAGVIEGTLFDGDLIATRF